MTTESEWAHRPESVARLLPIMAAVFTGFLVIGLALPALPLHIHDRLGLGSFVVGLVAGAQFMTSLISRVWAGNFADSQGGKRALAYGLVAACAAGLLYLASLAVVGHPSWSAAILLLGRAALGGAESFIITGAVTWGLAVGGQSNTGRVIAWIGTAMYAAFAVGAPIGGVLHDAWGFLAIAAATTFFPLVALAMVAPMRPSLPQRKAPSSIFAVVGALWVPGIGLAMSSLGFGAMMTFASLLFAERGWTPIWAGVTSFTISFIVARIFLGHLADKVGGARVALVCIAIEAAGLALLWFASSALMAVMASLLVGFGYSLVYPGLGLEAVRRVPPQNRGLAMGAYTAFFDLALGITSPLLGLVAAGTGTPYVFLVSAIVVACSSFVAAGILRAGPGVGIGQ